MSPRTTDRGQNALRTRIGRRLITRFLLVGIIPLLGFAAAIYYQSSQLLRSTSRATVVGYSVLARGELFSALERARSRLFDFIRVESLTANLEAFDGINDVTPFRRLIVIDQGTSLNDTSGRFPWPEISQSRFTFLERDNVIATPPYSIGGEMTISLIAKRLHGGYLAGEMDPANLWQLARAGAYGPQEFVVVMDGKGRALASSSELLLPGLPVLPKLPDMTQGSGNSPIFGFPRVEWGFSDLWLEGAFGGERWGILVAQQSEAAGDVPYILLQSLVLLLALALCVIVLLSFRQTREIIAPVLEMSDASQRVTSDEIVNVNSAPPDELGDLARAFNRMSERLVSSQREKTALAQEAMVGRLAATVAHQINTPLAAMRCKLEMIAGKAQEASGMRVVLSQIDRIETIVRALLGFSRLRAHSSDRAHVAQIAGNVSALFRDSFESAGIRFDVDIENAGNILVPCSVDSFQELLVNLLENARDSCRSAKKPGPDGAGRHEVRLTIKPDDSHSTAKQLRIQVEDTGAGLGEDAAVIFEPFVTSKIQGTGLGLTICKRICESAGGSISAASHATGGGAVFTALFPLEGNLSR